MPPLPLARYRVQFVAEGTVRFGDFPGNAWRGALGHALRRTVCVTRAPVCADCLLYRSCLYPYFFETPPAADAAKMRRYSTAPHSFVLEAQAQGSGHETVLHFSLVGRANVHLPVFVHALREAAASPRGVAGSRMEWRGLEQEENPGSDDWRGILDAQNTLTALPPSVPVPAHLPPTTFTVELRTPLRVKRDGRLVRPAAFRFADLFGNLLRRVSMLIEFHTETSLDADFRRLNDLARGIEVRGDLRWQEQRRYSARQSQPMEFGGLVGALHIDPNGLDELWPYLWLGQWVHAGTGATMGLGEYRIASLPDAAAGAAAGTMTEETPCR
jgi:hypothetical protein